jgi:hypothetical protein
MCRSAGGIGDFGQSAALFLTMLVINLAWRRLTFVARGAFNGVLMLINQGVAGVARRAQAERSRPPSSAGR